MNELDPYLFKKNKNFEIGRAEFFLEPEQVERIPKNRKFENYRLLKKKQKIMNLGYRSPHGIITKPRVSETHTNHFFMFGHVFRACIAI